MKQSAVAESVISDRVDYLRNRKLRNRCTAVESVCVYRCKTFGQGKVFKRRAPRKRALTYRRQSGRAFVVFKRKRRKGSGVAECVGGYNFRLCAYCNALRGVAEYRRGGTVRRVVDGVPVYVCKSAVCKRALTYRCHSFRNNYGCKRSRTVESVCADYRQCALFAVDI